MRALLTISLIVVVLVPAVGNAQEVPPEAPHLQAISINPLGFAMHWYNAEYERKITTSSTMGLSASRFAIQEADLRRATLFARYYPQGAALSGAYIGGRLGVLRAGDDLRGARALVLGVEVGYTWIDGEDRNVTIGIGGGMDRYLGTSGRQGFTFAVPQFRLVNVGIAF
jgi:hypothetical protein